MKTFVYSLLTIIFSLTITVLGAVAIFGKDKTFKSLELVGARIINLQQPARQLSRSGLKLISENGHSLLSESDFTYQSLNVNANSVREVEFHKRPSPFIVPSDGIAGHRNFVYVPPMHGGIDIWTNKQGTGVDGKSSKGYPVYAACGGKVTRVYKPNQEIEIVCDPIDPEYADTVPSLKVKTLYAHMGDAVNKEQYHQLKVGQRVEQGELIGYQGNVSSITPVNRVTHLHFGVYDLTKGGVPPTLNPETYIGVPCTIEGQKFVAGIN